VYLNAWALFVLLMVGIGLVIAVVDVCKRLARYERALQSLAEDIEEIRLEARIPKRR
jgi:hypothetical protein